VRCLVTRRKGGPQESAIRLEDLRREERRAGLHCLETYRGVGVQAQRVRRDLLQFLNEAKSAGQRVLAYGAPSRGTTLLNYCDITPDLLGFTVDLAPRKQGRFLPGCHIPVRAPVAIVEAQPDYLLILAWTLLPEIMQQMSELRAWGGRFVAALPELTILD
jgi:hypothetical protein